MSGRIALDSNAVIAHLRGIDIPALPAGPDAIIPVPVLGELYGDYGILRARYSANLSIAKVNDLWIAALCLQHNLPLLTNDRGFDAIAGLTIRHW